MPKKRNISRYDPIFVKLRKKLPRYFLSDLAELLPDMDYKTIQYVQEKRCSNMELKEKVAQAMLILVHRVQKKKQKLNSKAEKV